MVQQLQQQQKKKFLFSLKSAAGVFFSLEEEKKSQSHPFRVRGRATQQGHTKQNIAGGAKLH